MPMKNVARQYSCVLCHKMVAICRACDRGHIYCSQKCSHLARSASKCASDRKYQSNQRGKSKHAERQKRYRLHMKKIVTDHTSKPLPSNDLLPPTLNETGNTTENIVINLDNDCHFCGKPVNIWILNGPYQ